MFKSIGAALSRLFGGGNSGDSASASLWSGPKKEIDITRMIDENRQRVWDAWTKPEYLSEWWGVPPVAATKESVSIDFKVGGRWRADMIHQKDGTKLPFGGKYLEIDAPDKLVFTIEDENKPGDPNFETVTLTFKDRMGTTEMRLHQEGHLPIDQYGEPLRQGYSAFFDRMVALLRTKRV